MKYLSGLALVCCAMIAGCNIMHTVIEGDHNHLEQRMDDGGTQLGNPSTPATPPAEPTSPDKPEQTSPSSPAPAAQAG